MEHIEYDESNKHKPYIVKIIKNGKLYVKWFRSLDTALDFVGVNV